MKNLKRLTCILLICVLFSACGREEVRLNNDKKPFIIGSIKMIDDDTWRYVHKNFDTHRFWDTFAAKPAIVAPARVWEVGDTIKIQIK